MISERGYWNDAVGVPENYPHSESVALAIANCMAEGKNMRTPVIDFGCGDCYLLDYLHEAGFKVHGVDGYIPEHAKKLRHFSVFSRYLWWLDLSRIVELTNFKKINGKPAPAGILTGKVISLEVGEHIPAEYEQIFLDNLVRHCNSRLILSWAVPGQNGIGHVNCRPNDYVIAELDKRGFTFNASWTKTLREVPEQHVAYFRETLMVFDKTIS